MAWSPLLEALLLVIGGLALFGVWISARRRDRRITQALRQSEERFRHLTSLSADWFWETDAEHRISWLSGGPAVSALFGSEMAHGKRLWEVPGVMVEPRAQVEHFERLEELDAQMPFFDFMISRSDAGERRAHRITGKPRYDASGKFLGYRGVGQDITDKRRAEHALAEAKERLELATEGGNLAIWDIDVGSDRIHLGSGWVEMLGARRYERSLDIYELIHPNDREEVRAAFRRTLKGGHVPGGLEFRLRTVADDWKWMFCSGRVTQRDADGRALRMSGTVVEIDARKRAEQETREARERYRLLVELAPDGVVMSSREGVIEYANPAAARILKARNARQLLGMRPEEYIHPDHHANYRERRASLEAGPGSNGFEECMLCGLDGSDIAVEIASASYLERGRLVVQTVLRDITEQRETRQALIEREKRFRDVLEASGEYVWETDIAWRYTFLSERVESVLGHARSDLIGRTPREFMPLGEARTMDAWFAQRAAHAEAFRGQVYRSLTKSGQIIWQSVTGVPVFDAAGKFTGYRGTGADITARKQAEERIES